MMNFLVLKGQKQITSCKTHFAFDFINHFSHNFRLSVSRTTCLPGSKNVHTFNRSFRFFCTSASPQSISPSLQDLNQQTTTQTQIKKHPLLPQPFNPNNKYTLGKYNQHPKKWRDSYLRIKDWNEINGKTNIDLNSTKERLSNEASRCMDCGTPFCHTSYTGCPLNNLIPEWNSLVMKNNSEEQNIQNNTWIQALERLHKTNNFPEFTGRVCPAPCEGACVAGIVGLPVTIKDIEYNIVDYGFKHNLIHPRIVPNSLRSGKNVVIIGSGPSGMFYYYYFNYNNQTTYKTL